MMLNIDRPSFTASYDIEIFAPPDKVWDWLSRVDMWSSWRHDVSNAHWVADPGERGIFKWRLRKMIGFTAKVIEWRRERGIRWQATSYGANLLHDLKIDGDIRKTHVSLEISGSGGPLRFLLTRALFLRQLDRSNQVFLGALKTKLEAGKDDSTEPPPGFTNPFENNVQLPGELGPFDR